MRSKYLIIYIAAGVAFLAVSLWAFLSNGRSAKAVRAKYRLGGIMLTAWAMLSAASCGNPPFVTCYEPVVECYDVAMPENELYVSLKDTTASSLKSGEVLVVSISNPTFERYRCRVTADPENGNAFVIQTEEFDIKAANAGFELTLVATEYTGKAKVTVCGLAVTDGGAETETPLGSVTISIL